MGDAGPMPPCRVAVVDDQPVSRAGMEQVVGADPGLSLVASVNTVEELDGRVAFDVVVLDLPLRTEKSTLAVISRLAEVSRPLVISAWDRSPTVMAAIRAGAHGCATRKSDWQAVAMALRVISQGGFYLCHRLVEEFHAELTRPPHEDPNGLTPREVETLRWIAMGFTHSQIATRMGLSQATVNTYAKRIRAKLNVNNKAELTRMAIQLGHLTDDHLTDDHRDHRAA
jgi:DNA-binding NarL/FixJ family response regulator